MRVLVCGGRDYADRAQVFEVLDNLLVEHEIEFLVHGGEPGADTLAAEWAVRRDVKQIFCSAAWSRAGRDPELVRLHRMFEVLLRDGACMVVAFPGGFGTAAVVERARAHGVSVLAVEPRERARPAPRVRGGWACAGGVA